MSGLSLWGFPGVVSAVRTPLSEQRSIPDAADYRRLFDRLHLGNWLTLAQNFPPSEWREDQRR